MRRCLGTSTLFIGLAGCFSPSVPTGALCAAPGSVSRCPTGQQCIAHDGIETCEVGGSFPDAGDVDVDADMDVEADRDGDGIVDSLDNCPDVASLNQRDEDSDLVGDLCDLCPPFPNNTDGDGDGVGDACDPNPATAGDKLVSFEGFAEAPPASWTSSGTFVRSNGDGVLVADDAEASLFTTASPIAAHVEIRAALKVDAITAMGLNLGSISLVDRLQPNSDKSVACQLSSLANGVHEELRIFDASGPIEISAAAHAFSMGTETELRLRRDGTSYACRVTGPSLELTGTAVWSPTSPRIGLRTRGASARFHWVMITTSP